MTTDGGSLLPKAIFAEQDIFKNEFIRLYSVRVEFEGFEREYFVTDKGRRVGVLLWRGDQVLLVRQYRFLINAMSWELPGGGIKEGEAPEQAAFRECREEAGVSCNSLRPVFRYDQGIDVTLSPAFIFESRDFNEHPVVAHNNETDRRMWLPYEECIRQVLSGEIRDSMTMMALLACDVMARRAQSAAASLGGASNC
jgi:8-oxo-dGTP pyrophosphatase MutT (NUDIX family)